MEQVDEWGEKRDILLSVPGIGTQVVNILLADLPELGELTNKGSVQNFSHFCSAVTPTWVHAKQVSAASRSRSKSILR